MRNAALVSENPAVWLTGWLEGPIVATFCGMNAKLLFKTLFTMLMLLLLVMMGIHNKGAVQFSLPPILPKAISQPAGIMFFAFFALGFVTSTILKVGSKGSGASKPSKPSKS